MNPRAQQLFPVQARYYRAMVFYRRAQWALVLWAASVLPTSIGLAPRYLPWPWCLAPLFIQLALGMLAVVWVMPWLELRWLRCRRVYRVMNWKCVGLRFSHARAWKNWPDESHLPTVIEITKRYTVYGE